MIWWTSVDGGDTRSTPSSSSRRTPSSGRASRSSVVQPPVRREIAHCSGHARASRASWDTCESPYRKISWGCARVAAGDGAGYALVSDDGERSVPGKGLINGLAVTLKTMTQRSTTQQYPDVEPELPPRSRGRDRAARGELHGLHAVRPRVPRLVHLHRLAQGRGRRPRRGPAPAAQRARQVRHRLLPLHVLRHLHRGLPVRRAALDARVRVRRDRRARPAARQGPAGRLDADRAAAAGPRRARRAVEGGGHRGPQGRRPGRGHCRQNRKASVRRTAAPTAATPPSPARRPRPSRRPHAHRVAAATPTEPTLRSPPSHRSPGSDRRGRAAAGPRGDRGRFRRPGGDQHPPGPRRPLPGDQPGRDRRALPGARRRAGRLGAGAGLRRRGRGPAALRRDADPGPDRPVRRPGPPGLARPP